MSGVSARELRATPLTLDDWHQIFAALQSEINGPLSRDLRGELVYVQARRWAYLLHMLCYGAGITPGLVVMLKYDFSFSGLSTMGGVLCAVWLLGAALFLVCSGLCLRHSWHEQSVRQHLTDVLEDALEDDTLPLLRGAYPHLDLTFVRRPRGPCFCSAASTRLFHVRVEPVATPDTCDDDDAGHQCLTDTSIKIGTVDGKHFRLQTV